MCKILANILLTKTCCIRVRDGYKKQTQEGASDLNTAFKFFTNHIDDSSSPFSPKNIHDILLPPTILLWIVKINVCTPIFNS